MRKILIATAALLTAGWLAVEPVAAQLTLPGHYKYEFAAETRFRKPVVFFMGVPRSANQLVQQGLLNGTLYHLATVTNSVTTGTTTVGITLPANSLVSAAHGIRVRVQGTTAANANAKTVNLVFGSTTVQIMNAVAANAKDFYADVEITRTGANAQSISVAGYANGALLNALSTTSTQTETSSINLQVQVPATTANNDVVINDLTIYADAG